MKIRSHGTADGVHDLDGSVHAILMSPYRQKGVSYEDQKSWSS